MPDVPGDGALHRQARPGRRARAARGDDGPAPLSDLAAFRRFIDGIGERCDVAPVASELRPVSLYG